MHTSTYSHTRTYIPKYAHTHTCIHTKKCTDVHKSPITAHTHTHEQHVQKPHTQAPAGTAYPPRILIAEDNKVNQKVSGGRGDKQCVPIPCTSMIH